MISIAGMLLSLAQLMLLAWRGISVLIRGHAGQRIRFVKAAA